MTKKAWIIFAAMCVGLIGGLIFLQQRNQIDVSSVDTTKVQHQAKAAILASMFMVTPTAKYY